MKVFCSDEKEKVRCFFLSWPTEVQRHFGSVFCPVSLVAKSEVGVENRTEVLECGSAGGSKRMGVTL